MTNGLGEKLFSVADSDIVLIGDNSGGTACPMAFFFVIISGPNNATFSPEFGTCSDLVRVSQTGKPITVTNAGHQR